MKPHNKYLHGLISIIALIHLVGCTHIGNITETPMLQIGSPLRSVEPKKFAFRDFQDIRGVDDPSFMIQLGIHKNLMNQPPAIFVADRIKKEFERNGHKCIDASSLAKADFIVDGKFYRLNIYNRQGFLGIKHNVKTGVKLTITRVPNESDIFMKSYDGQYDTTSQIATADRIAFVCGHAVLSMIKEISTDPELIEFIKK